MNKNTYSNHNDIRPDRIAQLEERHADAVRIMVRVSSELAALRAAARAVVESYRDPVLGTYPGTETVASYHSSGRGDQDRVFVSVDPLAALAALLLEAEGGQA